ncbi:MAG: hypothetical protein AAGA37_13815 [Actinomycetota bacterium]
MTATESLTVATAIVVLVSFLLVLLAAHHRHVVGGNRASRNTHEPQAAIRQITTSTAQAMQLYVTACRSCPLRSVEGERCDV